MDYKIYRELYEEYTNYIIALDDVNNFDIRYDSGGWKIFPNDMIWNIITIDDKIYMYPEGVDIISKNHTDIKEIKFEDVPKGVQDLLIREDNIKNILDEL